MLNQLTKVFATLGETQIIKLHFLLSRLLLMRQVEPPKLNV